jgi:hypothetical protein
MAEKKKVAEKKTASNKGVKAAPAKKAITSKKPKDAPVRKAKSGESGRLLTAEGWKRKKIQEEAAKKDASKKSVKK